MKAGDEILNAKALFVDDMLFEVMPSAHIIGAVVAVGVFVASGERGGPANPIGLCG